MKIQYEVSDGYVGRGRPLYCEVDDEEFVDMAHDFEDDDAGLEYELYDRAEEDMRDKISASITNMPELMAYIKKMRGL